MNMGSSTEPTSFFATFKQCKSWPLFKDLFLYPTCGYNVFDPSVRRSVRPCVIICCRQDSAYICWRIYTKFWEAVSNSKSLDKIDFQKNLSRGSLFWKGNLLLVKFVSYVVAWIAPTFVDGYTQNFEKLSVIVNARMGLIFRKICHGDHYFGGGHS
jgi:hypothetical protein